MNEETQAWTILIILSISTGGLFAYYIKGRFGAILSGLIPWLGLLASLLYQEYFVPYQGGGASMWPIAQLFGGTLAAALGAAAYFLTIKVFNK